MRKIISLVALIGLIVSTMAIQVFASTNSQDVRAVWISTVYNLDYPSAKNNEQAQKQEFIQILDTLQESGINTVIVQVRPKADALYNSAINPWSDVLTGTQGKNPGYDPLSFMIEEAHKRGMAIHAWLNPYRVTTSGTDLSALSLTHPARVNPSWVITHNNALYYNPELSEVKQHIVDTVVEIVKNYDVDGIHFDDYFYPSNYPLPTGETKDGVVANARRGHVNDMISKVGAAIKKTNPKVVFGVSPSGIWKNDLSDITGSNTSGSESYYSVYADTRTWIQNEWIDYVVPQIYWETGHKQADYETLVKWWANEVAGTKVQLYIGQGIYKDVVASEIDKQLSINQNYSNVKGSFYFSLRDLLANRMGSKDKISKFYETNQITPDLPTITPEKPSVSSNAIGKTGITIPETLNVRSGAREDRPIVTKISKGTKVTILDLLSGWYKVKLPDNKVGWVSGEYIEVNYNNETIPPTTSTQTGTVTAESLNVRNGAGTQYQVIAKLSKGNKVTITNKTPGWYQIKLSNGQLGWVSQSYIK